MASAWLTAFVTQGLTSYLRCFGIKAHATSVIKSEHETGANLWHEHRHATGWLF